MTHGTHIVFHYHPSDVPREVLQMLEQRLPAGFSIELIEQHTAQKTRLKAVAAADFILGYPGALSDEEIESATRVRLFQLLSAGYDHVDLAQFAKHSIPVANNGGANAPTVAEHTIMLILAVFKKLPLHHASLLDGVWLGADETMRMRELRGKTVGIIGFGRIGWEVARLAGAFRTRVLYHDVTRAPSSVEAELQATATSLETLLRQSDVVTVHISLNDRSRHLINAKALELMQPSAIIVNTSRGQVIDERALVEKLRRGELAGAALDVFEHEPMQPGNPLRQLGNVVLTPHIAGISRDTWSRRIEFGYANIERVSAGKAPESVVS